jgi:Bacterial RNA polymerase, alpha chain C terminal domain
VNMPRLDWQPIETAPRDGTPILVNVVENIQIWGFECLQRMLEENVTIAAWLGTPGDAREFGWVTIATALAMVAGLRNGLNGTTVFPTHWMPLPRPPVRAEDFPRREDLVASLALSTRARNVLKHQGFRSLEDLRRLAEMPDAEVLRWPKVGQTVLREIREVVDDALRRFACPQTAEAE